MEIPRYWVRATGQVPTALGRPYYDIVAWGWSNEDRAGAERKAHERLLAAFAQRVQQGLDLNRGYAYAGKPLREEIVQELNGRGAAGVVTRNSYGSLVLNTAGALFIDIDLPEAAPAPGFLAGLFGKKPAVDPRDAALATLREGLQRASSGSFRIYQTAAGSRVLATDRTYDPRSPEAQALMTAVRVDPAFLHLCRIQESFRARLSPKPWRCGQRLPPGQHPRDDEGDRSSFAQWLSQYDHACQSKATCQLVESVGGGKVDEEIQPILDLHDSATRATSGLPLA